MSEIWLFSLKASHKLPYETGIFTPQLKQVLPHNRSRTNSIQSSATKAQHTLKSIFKVFSSLGQSLSKSFVVRILGVLLVYTRLELNIQPTVICNYLHSPVLYCQWRHTNATFSLHRLLTTHFPYLRFGGGGNLCKGNARRYTEILQFRMQSYFSYYHRTQWIWMYFVW